MTAVPAREKMKSKLFKGPIEHSGTKPEDVIFANLCHNQLFVAAISRKFSQAVQFLTVLLNQTKCQI